MFRDQAEFMIYGIKQILETYPKGKNFTIVGHSLGCLAAKFIEHEINKNETLQNIVCLSGTLEQSPMKLNGDMQKIIDETKMRSK